jgi:hypothetical protein
MDTGRFIEAVKRHLGYLGDVAAANRAVCHMYRQFSDYCIREPLSVAESRLTVLTACIQAQE